MTLVSHCQGVLPYILKTYNLYITLEGECQ